MSSNREIEQMERKLQENILAIIEKKKEIKRLKEASGQSSGGRAVKKLEDDNQKLKKITQDEEKEINGLIEKIFDLQAKLSKQAEEIRVLTEENKKLKQQ